MESDCKRIDPAMNPGSPAAVAAGCSCSRASNCLGRGFMGGVVTRRGDTLFSLSLDCPLHGEQAAREERHWADFHRVAPVIGDGFTLGPVPELRPMLWNPRPTIGQRRAAAIMAQVEEQAR